MSITLIPCGCACVEQLNPCGCTTPLCDCVTNVKIYSTIYLEISAVGMSPAIVYSGATQRAVNYLLFYTNSLASLIDIPNPTFAGTVSCNQCRGSGFGFTGDASQNSGFLNCELDYRQTWELAGGTECPPEAIDCAGSSFPPLEFGPCPKDVCVATGQILHISSTAGLGESDFQESNCNYAIGEEEPDDHITVYACVDDRGPYPDSDSLFTASFDVCPTSSVFDLTLQFGVNNDLAFSISTSPSGGQSFGIAQVNDSRTLPLYITYNLQGSTAVSISGSASIAIEFDDNAVARDPITLICPSV